MAGAFVSVHLESPAGNSLSICEAFVYTDQVPFDVRCLDAQQDLRLGAMNAGAADRALPAVPRPGAGKRGHVQRKVLPVSR